MKKTYLSTAMTAFMLSLASLTVPPVGGLHAADIFTKITKGPGSDAGISAGAAWGDYDNDGFIDLFVPQVGSTRHFLYHNNTNGTFSRVTNGPVATVASDGRAAVWGDYDNDGYLDLALMNANQSNHLFHNNGNGSFASIPSGVIVSDAADSYSVTWVDYDNDGYLDLFRAALRQPHRLYRNNHNGTFTRITQGAFLTVPFAVFGVAWGDYNNDGRPDLFVPQADEGSGLPNYLYRNDGGGTFTRVGAGMLDGAANGRFAAWGDYDNDGDLDLFVACVGGTENRPNRFYRNDGNDTFTSLTSLPANDPENQGGASTGCNWGDYDNDGWLDLFVVNRYGQNDFLYHNNGDGAFTKVLGSIAVKDGADSRCPAWGDYDNDGFLDLFVGNVEGSSFLYHNNTNDNHWLTFRLIGTRSNRAAIGAKLRARAAINGQTFWQMREISGGDGRNGQNSLHVHVGLGNATNADLVRIEWPSGIVQEFRDVAANQVLTIQESGVDIFPANADVPLGATLTLSVTNAPPDSTLQWRLNGVDIAGATNATLELSSVTTNNTGSYRVTVSNTYEVVTSALSTVWVFDGLTITTQPQSIPAVSVSGVTVGFSVAAVGPLPITYQWQRNGVDLAGQTNRFLTVSASVATAGNYTAVVSDANGSVVSQPATLTVLVAPIISQGPLGQSVVAGGNVTFSVALNGASTAPFTYEWRKGSSFATATLLANVASAERTAFLTLTNVQPAAAGTYRLYVANVVSPTITDTSPNRVWNLTVLADTDGDGLPEAWETANGLNPNDPSDATTDADGDGLSNLAEYRSGTSPTNAVSRLQLESLTPTNGQAMVSFPAAANQTYTVEWSDQLSGGSWEKLNDVVARPTDTIATVTDSNAVAPTRFYRVVTPRRP